MNCFKGLFPSTSLSGNGGFGGEVWWGSMVGNNGLGSMVGKYGGEVWWKSMVGKYGGSVWWGSMVGKYIGGSMVGKYGVTIRIGQEIQCLLYAGFYKCFPPL